MPISVLLPLALPQSYDYLSSQEVRLGQFVRVPLRNKEIIGAVWQLDGQSSLAQSKMREIKSVIDFVPPLNQELRDFIDWVAKYTLAPKGLVLKACDESK